MATVTLSGVSKTYAGDVEALRELSLEVGDGEFVTLVGPSGCGKSTTLELIAGLQTPTSGEICIGGELVNDRPPRERDVAMVFQDYALYPHMNVRRNIGFPLKFGRLDRAERARLVVETAELLGLQDLLDRRPRDLSGGQRQRVALARALVRRPKVFLFDEPLSNLDPALRIELRAELKRLHAELAATFIYVTHDQAEAMTLSDRVVVLDRGALQQVGPPSEIYGQPANTFVARFFGLPRINLVRPGDVGLDRDRDRGSQGGRSEGAVVIGIRPEDLRFGAGEAPPDAAVAVTVDLVEPVGSESWITVRRGDVRLTARVRSSLDVAVGQPAWIAVDPERVLRFDAASGDRTSP